MVFEFQRLTVGFHHSDFSLVFSIELTLTLNIIFVLLSNRSTLSRIELSTPPMKLRQGIW